MTRAPDGVFISYRHDDAEREAHDLWKSLTRRLGTRRVFIDIESLAPGDAWLDRLSEVIEGCAAIIVVIGPAWNPPSPSEGRGRLFAPDDVVRTEVARGLAAGRRVIPVLVRGAILPSALMLPPELRDLPAHQAAATSESGWALEVERLASLVELTTGPVARLPDLGANGSDIIGRDDLMTEIVDRLAQDRLVTLTGPGGCGKTSVATAVAHRVCAGLWAAFVDLTTVRHPERVPRAIADALGATEAPEDEELSAAARLLRDRDRPVLILDNCEHLLDACADAVARLLSEVPTLRVLATGREPFALEGEQVVPVPPLAVPNVDADADGASGSDAVRLFLQRVQSTVPSFTLDERTTPAVVDICRRVEGLPLAIELAAARVHAMDVVDIATRLVKRFDLLGGTGRSGDVRHQTMAQAIDWSYGLLGSGEARLFDRLWVFEGGFDLDAAEAVCGDSDVDVVMALPALVERSLVVLDRGPDGSRYRLLEPIRQYGETHAGEHADAVARRHTDNFVSLVEAAEPHIRGPEQDPWRRRLRREAPNLRRAADWAGVHDPEVLGRIVSATWWYWPGSIGEVRALAGRALELRPRMTGATAIAVTASATLPAFFEGDLPRCIDLADEAIHAGATGLALHQALTASGSALREVGAFDEATARHERTAREATDPWWVARARYSLGLVAAAVGELEAAAGDLELAWKGFEALGDRNAALEVINVLAAVMFRAGASDRAEDLCQLATALIAPETSPDDRAGLLLTRSYALLAAGDVAGAVRACREAFQLIWDFGMVLDFPLVLERAAAVAVKQGEPRLALTLLAASDVRRGGPGVMESTEVTGWILFPQSVADTRDAAVSELSDEETLSAWRRGVSATTDDLPALISDALALDD